MNSLMWHTISFSQHLGSIQGVYTLEQKTMELHQCLCDNTFWCDIKLKCNNLYEKAGPFLYKLDYGYCSHITSRVSNQYVQFDIACGVETITDWKILTVNEITSSILFMQQSEMNHTQQFFEWNLKYLLSSLPKLTDALPGTAAGERP